MPCSHQGAPQPSLEVQPVTVWKEYFKELLKQEYENEGRIVEYQTADAKILH